jgi:photosystem II stability/assembly factor-like uncharacterized protein
MKRLLIVLTILALLAVLGYPTLARNNNVEHETWNLEHTAGDNVWTQCSQGMWGGNVEALALSPGYASDSTLFAGTVYGGVFKSTDGGASWSAVNTGLPAPDVLDVYALALSPGYASDHTLFAGTSGGAFKSTDGGASWSAVNTGLTYLVVGALVLSPSYATDHTLFAGSYGVYKSTDGGTSWNAVNTGLPSGGTFPLSVQALALSPGYASDHTLFVGVYWEYYCGWMEYCPAFGVFKSTDGGASWTAAGLYGWDLSALALSPGYATDGTVFAGTHGDGVFKSSDGGASSSAVNTGLTNLRVEALALSPGYASDHTLFAGTIGGGVFKSTDGGAFWSAMNEELGNLNIWSLALTPTFPRTLFAGTDGSSVWQYTLLRPYNLWLPVVFKGYGMW